MIIMRLPGLSLALLSLLTSHLVLAEIIQPEPDLEPPVGAIVTQTSTIVIISNEETKPNNNSTKAIVEPEDPTTPGGEDEEGTEHSKSSASTRIPKTIISTTTIKNLRKIVHVTVDPAVFSDHPRKPTAYPSFADYDQGVVYVAGEPHKVLDAQAEYRQVEEGEHIGDWVDVKTENRKGKNGTDEEEVGEDDGKGKGGDDDDDDDEKVEGKAVYSADMASAADNAVKKVVFFTLAAAGMTTLAVLVYFKIITP